jgi:type I site-specific restriction endonuclease
LPDDIQFDVDEFNKNVVTVPFNRTVADELARHIDPNLPGKTLIFAVNDAHADIIVKQVKETVQPFLDVRTAVLNDTLEDAFRHRYPGFRPANGNEAVALAA